MTSSAVSQQVNPASVTIALADSASAAVTYGTTLTFTATVTNTSGTSAVPSGVVKFMNGTTQASADLTVKRQGRPLHVESRCRHAQQHRGLQQQRQLHRRDVVGRFAVGQQGRHVDDALQLRERRRRLRHVDHVHGHGTQHVGDRVRPDRVSDILRRLQPVGLDQRESGHRRAFGRLRQAHHATNAGGQPHDHLRLLLHDQLHGEHVELR